MEPHNTAAGDESSKLTELYQEPAGPDPSLELDITLKYVDQICGWVSACDELHGNVCVPKPILERPPEDVPRWLIDTHHQCIVPGLSAHRYLALSYIWPESLSFPKSASLPPRTLLLDQANVDIFQRPRFLSEEGIAQQIPMTIRHAMGLTHAVGERYLWVDRLCIVQHDLGDGGTLSQVAMMDKIYAGAYFTIIAAASEGIYEHDLAFELLVNANMPIGYNRFTRYVVVIMKERYDTLSSSRWATRGWTYQGQILCKRAVFFMDSRTFWDCQCAMWDGAELHPNRKESADFALRAYMGQRFSTRWWPDFAFYLDLICPYNGREFSYPQDALRGISGVLNALENFFPEVSFLGYRDCSSITHFCGSLSEQQIVAWIVLRMISFNQAYPPGRGVVGKVSSTQGAFAPACHTFMRKSVKSEPGAGAQET